MHHEAQSEHDAAEIILSWAQEHGAHNGALINIGDWSRVLSCPACGKDAFTTIGIQNYAQERAMAGYKAGSRAVMF
jgi:hypothetical protein